MATLTNTKIKDTYDGLLKTTDNDVLDVSGVTLIEDGLGNASALSLGRANNGVTITGALVASGLTYPTTDGTVAGQAIVTDAAGNLSFATVTTDTPNLQEVTDVSPASTTNSITVGGITAAGYVYPTSGGSAGQAIVTDGAGNLSFATVAGATPTLDDVVTSAVGANVSSIDIEVNGLTVGKGNNSRTNNAALGVNALTAVTTGNQNTAIGSYALEDNTIGINNTAVGYRALYNNTSGGENVAIGSSAMGGSLAGSFNIAIGSDALSDGDCQYSIAIGDGALTNNTSNNNTSIGAGSLSNINGANNVALGYEAGDLVSGGSDKTLGDDNVYIGAYTKSSAADTDNEIVIGANAVGNGSNSATYGDSNVTKHIFTGGDVGIGEQNPSAPLEVKVGLNSLKISGRDTYIDSTIDSANANIYVTQAGVGDFGQEAGHLVLQARTQGTVYRDIIFAGGLANGQALMTINGQGNVGINCSPASGVKLQVNGDGSIFRLDGTANTSRGMLLRNVGTATAEIKTDGNLDFNIEDAGRTMRFLNGNTERMRITSGGQLQVGGTAQSFSARIVVHRDTYSIESRSTGTGSEGHLVFNNGNGAVGSIFTNGTSTSYNTSSDYRLKENVVPMEGALDRVDALKPSRFNFIADPEKTVDGFIAHEVQAIIPEAVTGEKDAVDEEGNPVYQGVDYSKVVPLLTSAIQELRAEIEMLKKQING